MDLKKFIGSQIKSFRLSRGMNQEELAELLDTTKQTISRYENGDRQANQDILFMLSKIFNTSINNFFPEVQPANSLLMESTTPYNAGIQHNYYPTSISAGLPLTVDSIDATKISVSAEVLGKYKNDKDIYFARINGDSMDNLMDDGTLIAIKPTPLENLSNGDIVVFSHNHEYSVKHFYKAPNKVIFKPNSTNDCHHEQHFDLHDDVTIHGKVITYIINLD